MADGIRQAIRSDVSAILDLAEAKREEYQRYQPTFWRKAGDSRERQRPFLERLISDENVITFVHEVGDTIDALIVGSIVPAPPVYDPGGPVCLIDDFVSADDATWKTAGDALLDAVAAEAKRRGAALCVVITGHLDRPKREMLAASGYVIASEWHTREL
jgi:hypothetical protein